jgi:hypothetical protein
MADNEQRMVLVAKLSDQVSDKLKEIWEIEAADAVEAPERYEVMMSISEIMDRTVH